MSQSRMRMVFAIVLSLSLPGTGFAAQFGQTGAAAGAPIVAAPVAIPVLTAPAAGLSLPAGLGLPNLALPASASIAAGQASAPATGQASFNPKGGSASTFIAPSAQIVPAAAADAKGAPAAENKGAQAPAAAALDDASVRGKTLLMVGTRGSRPFIIEEAIRVANALGLNLVLLDKDENRKNSAVLVPDADFVAAPIDKRDDKSLKSIVDQVQALKAQRPIDYVMAFRSHHAKLVGKIVDATGIAGVSGRVTLTAEDKVKTRKALNVDPVQYVAYKEVKTENEVREFWRQNTAVPGAKFVMKSKLGENSRFVELDIDTEEKLVVAFTKMDAALKLEAKKKESSDTIFNRYPGIMVERMLEKAPGTVEASVEMVVQNGKVKFAMVSDTHGIGKNGELAGGSMTFPSQMTPQIQDALIAASARALEIVGLTHGNARVDIMMTPEGPKVIEINPFLGGAAIHEAVRLVSGISLVEWGIRAMLGLALPQMPAFTTIVDYRFAASQFNGEILSVEGVPEAKAIPGVAHVQILEGPGESVAAPIENGFEEWAEVMGTGKTFEEAKRRSIAALAKLRARVVAWMTGDYLQPGAQTTKRP
jgi:hypothetical protein